MKTLFATGNDYGMLVLRVTAGAAMLPYGLTKVGILAGPGIAGTIEFFGGMGIPAFVAVLVMIAETVGAASMIFGFCTRFCAASLGVVMIGAAYTMRDAGFFTGYATPLLFLFLFLPLIVNGAGAMSMDGAIAKKMR